MLLSLYPAWCLQCLLTVREFSLVFFFFLIFSRSEKIKYRRGYWINKPRVSVLLSCGENTAGWPKQRWESLWRSGEMCLAIKGKSQWAGGRWIRNSLCQPPLPMCRTDPWSPKLSSFCFTLDCRDRYFIRWNRGKEGEVPALSGSWKPPFVWW